MATSISDVLKQHKKVLEEVQALAAPVFIGKPPPLERVLGERERALSMRTDRLVHLEREKERSLSAFDAQIKEVVDEIKMLEAQIKQEAR
jgi:hypothetical protein